MPSDETDDFIASLEKLGEKEVGIRFAKGVYGAQGHRRQLVEHWLQMQRQSLEDRREKWNSQRDNTAAIAAIVAAVAAIVAAIASVIPLLPK